MITEKRKLKNYNLTPKGKPLYEDESRFGIKMLKSMGWSVGKGLGRHEDGNTDILKVRCKNNVEGLGFIERNDQWTEHTEAFDSLLSNLNCNHNSMDAADSLNKSCVDVTENPGSADALKNKISGISLEEISKNSKARVHYKKFTKNKDLAQYSEKDLANIFGKKHTSSSSNISSNNNEIQCGNIEEIIDSSSSSVQQTSDNNMLHSKQSDEETNRNDVKKNSVKESRKKKAKLDLSHSDLSLVENDLYNSVINHDLNGQVSADKNQTETRIENKKHENELSSKLKEVKKTICEKTHSSPTRKGVDTLLESVKEDDDSLKDPADTTTKTERNKTIDKSKDIEKSAASYKCPALESLQSKSDSLNIYTISSFCAEKFANIDFERFHGSTIEQIEGYSLNPNIQLNIVNNLQNDRRVVKIWRADENEVIPKFDTSRKSYRNYLSEAINSRNNNESKPKLPVKVWKRKNAFFGV